MPKFKTKLGLLSKIINLKNTIYKNLMEVDFNDSHDWTHNSLWVGVMPSNFL